MHLTEGDLRAYLDRQMEAGERERARAHLAECPQCHAAAQALEGRAARISTRLDVLNPGRDARPLPVNTARARLQARLMDKEKTMFQKIFARPYRPAWIAVILVLALGGALAFPPVRVIANSFLGLFRVQKVAVVQVNPGDLPDQLGSSAQLESLFSQNVVLNENGDVRTAVDAAEASQMAGLPVRLPAGLDGLPRLKVSPEASISLTVDAAQVRAVLNEIGRSDIQVPDEVDGAVVDVQVFPSVTAMYGDCTFDFEAARRNGYDPDTQNLPRLPECTTLIQMPSPTISAPPGLDLTALGEGFLQLMGMTPDEAASFSRNVDWTTTFVIPIPRYGTSYEDVGVDGVTGTLITQELDNHGRQYMLIWVKDGILYTLTGPGVGEDAVQIAGTLQ